jgi:adenine deaminase
MGECIRAVTEEGLDSRRLILATDDMLSEDLVKLGHMNEIVKRTIAQGVDPVQAIQMVTINPAEYFGLKNVGVLTPGKLADIAIMDDLVQMSVAAVFIEGKLAANGGELLVEIPKYIYPETTKNSVKCGFITAEQLEIHSDKNSVTGRCIGLIPDQNLSEAIEEELRVNRGIVECDVHKDIAYILCVERYGRNGNIGKAFVKGFGLTDGAFAESVAHDTHNIVAAGTNLKDITIAINRVIELKGGIAIAKNGRILDELALPVGGLITDQLDGVELNNRMEELHKTTKDQLGCKVHAPFMHLSFLALSTSPKWKITDKGLVDVNNYKVISPIVD